MTFCNESKEIKLERSTEVGAFAFAAGLADQLAFSPAYSSCAEISGLTIDDPNFTANGTTSSAAQIIGMVYSNGSAENKVIISYEGISADVDELVGSLPDDIPKEHGTNSWTIIWPVTGGGGSVITG